MTHHHRRLLGIITLTTVALGNLPTASGEVLTWSFASSSSKVGQIKSITDRRSADTLLKRAREAIGEGNLELAEWYVERAEKLNVDFASTIIQRFADTPAKVRQTINQAKRSGQSQLLDDQAPGTTIPGPTASPQPVIPTGMPATGSADSAPLEAAVTALESRAAALLARGRTAISNGATSEAVRCYHSALGVKAKFAAGEYTPADLRQQLLAAGVRPELLAVPDQPQPIASTIIDPAELAGLGSQLPAILETPEASYVSPSGKILSPQDVTSSSLLQRAELIQKSALTDLVPPLAGTDQAAAQVPPASAAAYQSVMQLLAEARISMDRGDLGVAETFAVAAQRLAVPEEAFAPGQPRPWMVLAEIRKRQQGLQQPKVEYYSETKPRPFAAPPMMDMPPAAQPPSRPDVVSALVVNNTNDTSQVIATAAQQPLPATTHFPVAQTQARQLPPAELSSTDFPATNIPATPHQNLPMPVPESSELMPPSDARGPVPVPTHPVPTQPGLAQPVPIPAAEQPLNATPLAQEPGSPSSFPQTQLSSPPPASEVRSADGSPASLDEEIADEGVRLFNAGQEALSEQKIAQARQLFLDAWQHEGNLPPDVRQALQDNLQLTNRQSTPEVARNIVDPRGLSEIERAAVDQLLGEVAREQAAVRQLREAEPFAAWQKLKALRGTIAEADVDSASREQLLTRVQRELIDMEQYVEQNRARFENDERNKKILDEVQRSREQRVRNQQQLADLVEEFNVLMDQHRFPEAVVVAKKARELDPLEPTVQTMLWKSQVARQITSNMLRTERVREGVLQSLNDVEDSSIAEVGDEGLVFPDAREWTDLTDRRRKAMEANRRRFTEVELDIQRALKKSVDVKFEEQPLAYVVDQLARTAGINVFIDPEGLSAEGVTSDTSVSLTLRKPVSLKSALNLILQPLHLSYVIQDEVLRITSEQVRDGDTRPEVYHVADLVIPIPNFVPGYNLGLPGAIREAHNVLGQGYMGGATIQRPLTMMADNPGLGPATTSASVLAQMGSTNLVPSAGRSNSPYGMGPGSGGGGSQADFDTLIELITTTIDPDTWDEVGGQGTIAGFPTNLSLVVQQTQDVHNKIADLLAQLRRLQDLQVTIEVRFITLNDDFFERVGVDFDFRVDDNSGLNLTDVNNLDDDPPNVTIGLDPMGNPTVDLDIGFTQGSFGNTQPQFGGFDVNSAATLGFAILSDIEAFFVIQAAQGDARTNILQAPKVTLFNGQTAFVSDTSNRPFVTSVIPVVGDFAAAHQPVITVLTEGTSLTVQAVVSQDRRFVRLTLVPFFSKIGDVDTFTFEGSTSSDTGTTAVDPTDDTQVVRNNNLNNRQGTTVQLPTFSFTTVSTTVSVPDGGTILLGGIKRLSEGRNEQGIPILSNLPYVNRLFKNVGFGRETQSLMMMVTPRIIIQEEEEEKLGLAAP